MAFATPSSLCIRAPNLAVLSHISADCASLIACARRFAVSFLREIGLVLEIKI
jgi:hypothetical protein